MKNVRLGLLVLATILFSTGTFAQKKESISGNQKVETKERSVGSFSSISVGGGFDVYITQGSKTSLSVEADENLHDVIKTEIKGNALHISSTQNINRAKAQKIHVTVNKLTAINASGGSDVIVKNELSADNFSINASGGSDIELTLKAKSLNLNLSGGSDVELNGEFDAMNINASGGADLDADDVRMKSCNIRASGGADVNISGKANSLNVDISGGSDVNADDFVVSSCNVKASGSADAHLHVTESLEAHLSGSSDVVCEGKPSSVKKTVSKTADLKIM